MRKLRKYLPHIIEGAIFFLIVVSLAILGSWVYFRIIGQA